MLCGGVLGRVLVGCSVAERFCRVVGWLGGEYRGVRIFRICTSFSFLVREVFFFFRF